jgi:hypothetical protein
MSGYSTTAEGDYGAGEGTLPIKPVGLDMGASYSGYVSPNVYQTASAATRPGLAGARRYQYSLDPATEASLQSTYADIAGAEQAELGGIQAFIDSLETAERGGRRGIQSALGEGIGATWGGAGGRIPASAVMDAAQRGGESMAAFEAQVAPAILQSRYEAQELLGRKRREVDDRRSARIQELQNWIQGEKGRVSNWLTTDTSTLGNRVAAMAQFEPDPYVREWMLNEAGRIRSTPMNMFTAE